MATVDMASSWAVRKTRMAISPRLATRTFFSGPEWPACFFRRPVMLQSARLGKGTKGWISWVDRPTQQMSHYGQALLLASPRRPSRLTASSKDSYSRLRASWSSGRRGRRPGGVIAGVADPSLNLLVGRRGATVHGWEVSERRREADVVAGWEKGCICGMRCGSHRKNVRQPFVIEHCSAIRAHQPQSRPTSRCPRTGLEVPPWERGRRGFVQQRPTHRSLTISHGD